MFALGIGSPAWAGEPTIRIDDFEDLDLEAATGLSWMAIGDWLLGGASSGEVAVVRAAPQNGSRGALRLTGHLRKGKGTPFVSVWTGLRPDGLPRNLTGYRALRFRVRGTPGPYMAGLRRTEGKASANLVAPIAVTATWAAVEVPFDQLKQVLPSANPMAFAPTGIRWIGFTTSADTPPDFELDIDDVEIVPEPTPDEPGAWAVTKVKLTDARALDRLSFATVGRDARGDTVNARLPDARELQLAVDPAEGRVWFRFVLYDPPPAAYFGMNVALDVDGDPDNGGAWWGQNKAFHYDRLVTAYLAKGAGYWQGMVGVSDAAQIAEGRFSAVSKDVRVAVDPGRKTLAVGVPRSALGLPPGGRVRLIGTVGSNMTFNDDVPQEGALEVTIPDAGTSSSMSH
ncbi:MAG TPA: CIA30 family protein [Haliangiales bacterium]|nr:CIA30 family protein [Haliangiales bacterium]